MNYLDTRDLQKRLDELEEVRGEVEEESGIAGVQAKALAEWDATQEGQELAALQTLEAEIGREFLYGVTLIPEGEFVDYAEELAGDIGAIDRNATWPLNCIDWEQAADELRSDYTEIKYDGTTYLYR